MDLMVLKKKLSGFKASNGSIRDVSPEVLWELRTAWENFTGPIEQFRSELGIHTGTLRNLLASSKKLNHAMASVNQVAMDMPAGESPTETAPAENRGLELIYDKGEKVIRFPDVATLIDFLRRAA